jgi:hypothetical protein
LVSLLLADAQISGGAFIVRSARPEKPFAVIDMQYMSAFAIVAADASLSLTNLTFLHGSCESTACRRLSLMFEPALLLRCSAALLVLLELIPEWDGVFVRVQRV